MKIAILIPLYLPGIKHLLLIKSVISSCLCLQDVVIYIAADGPNSDVKWPSEAIRRLLDVASSVGIELRIYSYLQPAGYPKCYQVLLADAIAENNPKLIHFIDQDDYCLPSRFFNRSSTQTQASSTLVVSERFITLTRLSFKSTELTAVLETPAPGMTFSVPRGIADDYLELCLSHPAIENLAHDFVIAQISKRSQKLEAIPEVSMLYVQHSKNTIGYTSGLLWVYAKLRSPREVCVRTVMHAKLIDALYGKEHWPYGERLHHSKFRDLLYRVFLKFAND